MKEMSREQLLYESIIRRLDALIEKVSEVNERTERIEHRIDDVECSRYDGGGLS